MSLKTSIDKLRSLPMAMFRSSLHLNCQNWANYQMVKNKVKNGLHFLPTEGAIVLEKIIDHINATFANQPQPVPNYLMNSGGSAAIQRLIDAESTILSGNPIYHPSYLFSSNFPLSNICTGRKSVLNGV